MYLDEEEKLLNYKMDDGRIHKTGDSDKNNRRKLKDKKIIEFEVRSPIMKETTRHACTCLCQTRVPYVPESLLRNRRRVCWAESNSPDILSLYQKVPYLWGSYICDLGWLTVNDLIETETLKIVYKSKNQLAPEYLNSMFIKLSEFRNRQLRDSDTDLYAPLQIRHVAKKFPL